MADFTSNERSDEPNDSASERRDGSENDARVEPQGVTENADSGLPDTPAFTVETEEEGEARVNGRQEVPDELRGYALPTDDELPKRVTNKQRRNG